ncbi:MAG: flavodoxin domain-containing protein [Roseburia sp.]|nr:flavodoxin domain-containing protein [Anaeroplasma bactoclasticum]MCM1196111.1 flavodoxin domain-containing protein [Roseburia sp.]MCM1556007.1 flavodoxin domain-containing protein [Anaeroplasma bactoclasticum]
MKLILYFGHTGTTKKASQLLAEQFKDCTIINGMEKNKIEYSSYDTIIFGVNIHMGKLNKSFCKVIKKLTKKGISAKFACFIIAADSHQKTKYMNLAQESLPQDAYIGFFGGELDPTRARGLTKAIIQSCINQFLNQGLPLPTLDMTAIKDFAEHIN